MVGAKPHRELPAWFRAADVVALPSRSEGVPNVLQEAAACGTRFVASRVGGVPEIAGLGDGRLVESGNAEELAGAMEAGFCALAMCEGFTPGNPHLVTPDEACADLLLPRETLVTGPATVLNNSSGFGGSNVCHVFKRWAS